MSRRIHSAKEPAGNQRKTVGTRLARDDVSTTSRMAIDSPPSRANPPPAVLFVVRSTPIAVFSDWQRSGVGQGLFARSKGSQPVSLGADLPWAVVYAENVITVDVHFRQHRGTTHRQLLQNHPGLPCLPYTQFVPEGEPHVATRITATSRLPQRESEFHIQFHRPGKRTGWPLSLIVRIMAARSSAWRSS